VRPAEHHLGTLALTTDHLQVGLCLALVLLLLLVLAQS